MKIGVVYEHIDGGGAPAIVRAQIGYFLGSGHDVTFISSPSETKRVHILFPGLATLSLLSSKSPGQSALFRAAFVLRKLRQAQFNVLIIHSARTASYIGLLAPMRFTKLIVVEHAHPRIAKEVLSWRQRFCLWVVLKRATVVCVSEGSAKAFQISFGQRAQVIHNFCPTIPVRRSLHRQNNIVFLGRLAAEKRVDLLIHCFEQIADLCDWRLDIHGDGPLRESLRRQAEVSQFYDRISFHGWAADTRAILEEAGIFVLTSRYEGFGLALLEAMAAGAACISFDCPFGPREIIEDGLSGLLVPDGDIEGLGRAILELIKTDATRTQLGRNALARAAKFDDNTHFRLWGEVVASVQGHKHGKSVKVTAMSG